MRSTSPASAGASILSFNQARPHQGLRQRFLPLSQTTRTTRPFFFPQTKRTRALFAWLLEEAHPCSVNRDLPVLDFLAPCIPLRRQDQRRERLSRRTSPTLLTDVP